MLARFGGAEVRFGGAKFNRALSFSNRTIILDHRPQAEISSNLHSNQQHKRSVAGRGHSRARRRNSARAEVARARGGEVVSGEGVSGEGVSGEGVSGEGGGGEGGGCEGGGGGRAAAARAVATRTAEVTAATTVKTARVAVARAAARVAAVTARRMSPCQDDYCCGWVAASRPLKGRGGRPRSTPPCTGRGQARSGDGRDRAPRERMRGAEAAGARRASEGSGEGDPEGCASCADDGARPNLAARARRRACGASARGPEDRNSLRRKSVGGVAGSSLRRRYA